MADAGEDRQAMVENGRFSGLTTRQQAFLTQLLVDANVERAARAAGIGATTAWRYLKEDDFRRVYQEARSEQVESTVARLLACSAEAVSTLQRNMACGDAGAEIRAATAVLRNVLASKVEITGPSGGLIPIREIVVELRQLPEGMTLTPRPEPWAQVPPVPEPTPLETEAPGWGSLEVVIEEPIVAEPSWKFNSDE